MLKGSLCCTNRKSPTSGYTLHNTSLHMWLAQHGIQGGVSCGVDTLDTSSYSVLSAVDTPSMLEYSTFRLLAPRVCWGAYYSWQSNIERTLKDSGKQNILEILGSWSTGPYGSSRTYLRYLSTKCSWQSELKRTDSPPLYPSIPSLPAIHTASAQTNTCCPRTAFAQGR